MAGIDTIDLTRFASSLEFVSSNKETTAAASTAQLGGLRRVRVVELIEGENLSSSPNEDD